MNIQKFKIFHEISAGGVVINKEKRSVTFLMVHRNRMDDNTLPKGHQEKGESLQETAIREVKEETSILAVPQKYLGKFTYKVVDRKRNIIYFRTVHWFLMLGLSKKLNRKPNREISRVLWRPFNQKTFQLLTYQTDKNLLKKTKKLLKNFKF